MPRNYVLRQVGSNSFERRDRRRFRLLRVAIVATTAEQFDHVRHFLDLLVLVVAIAATSRPLFTALATELLALAEFSIAYQNLVSKCKTSSGYCCFRFTQIRSPRSLKSGWASGLNGSQAAESLRRKPRVALSRLLGCRLNSTRRRPNEVGLTIASMAATLAIAIEARSNSTAMHRNQSRKHKNI
jgi:hypothetical protein